MNRFKLVGKICATSKKALRSQACLHNRRCKPKKVGRAVMAGRVKGIVWCCKPTALRRASARLRSRERRRRRRR